MTSLSVRSLLSTFSMSLLMLLAISTTSDLGAVYVAGGSVVYDLTDMQDDNGVYCLEKCPCRNRHRMANLDVGKCPCSEHCDCPPECGCRVYGDSRFCGKQVAPGDKPRPHANEQARQHPLDTDQWNQHHPHTEYGYLLTTAAPGCPYIPTTYDMDPNCYVSDGTWDGWHQFGLFSTNHFKRSGMPARCYHYQPQFTRGQWNTITRHQNYYMRNMRSGYSH